MPAVVTNTTEQTRDSGRISTDSYVDSYEQGRCSQNSSVAQIQSDSKLSQSITIMQVRP